MAGLAGLGTGVPGAGLVGLGTGVARQVAVLAGTGTGATAEAPAWLAVGTAACCPFTEAVGVTAPGAAVPVAVGAALARDTPGLALAALAVLAVRGAAWPEPDAVDAEQPPARTSPAAIPAVQPATRLVLLCDCTCMLLEVVTGDDTNTGKYVGARRKLCPAASNLSPGPPV